MTLSDERIVEIYRDFSARKKAGFGDEVVELWAEHCAARMKVYLNPEPSLETAKAAIYATYRRLNG